MRTATQLNVRCLCGDVSYRTRAHAPNLLRLDAATAISSHPAERTITATWAADDFPGKLLACRACQRVWAHLSLGDWTEPIEYSAAVRTYPSGKWYGYTPPAPVTIGDVTLRTHIFTTSPPPSFAWALEHGDETYTLRRANPTRDEHAALADLITRFGPTGATVLAKLRTDADAPLADAIATTIDTLS